MPKTASTATYADGTVHAEGLPTDQVINFFVIDPDTSDPVDAWVLGMTPDGTWDVDVSSHGYPVPTLFEFGGRTKGKDGHYQVFASVES